MLAFAIAELASAGLLPKDLDGLLWRGGFPARDDRPLGPDYRGLPQVSSGGRRSARLSADRTR
ncbi:MULTISPECIES: hypothetical protein [unclassified Thiocapsa]|uniref:hypothetical protein n=1 Tax=unclassified Thiocapsa TaxID=2641286 RepID=UPI0035AFAD24